VVFLSGYHLKKGGQPVTPLFRRAYKYYGTINRNIALYTNIILFLEVKMRIRNILVIILVVGLGLLISAALPDTSAASPPATLTIDGVPVGSFPSVQAAVDAVTANPGTNFIIEVAAGTVSDPLNITQQPNKNVVLRPQSGATVTFTNTITIDGNGNLNNPETLLIEGFIFDFTAGTPENCIDFNLIPPHIGFSYPHNVTINGCTFRGVYDTVVAVQSVPGGSRNIAIMNCTATDMHSLAQLKAVSGYAFIQNCTVTNASGGVNFYGPGNLIVDSCNFEVTDYAVRSGQSAGAIQTVGSVDINNSILKNNSASVGTVVLRGDSTNNINVIHTNLENAAAGGSVIQNINAASASLYDIDIVETNLTGQITGVDPSTITIIDDPNVENGPICVNNGNGSNCQILWFILALIGIIALFVLIIIFRRRWWVIFL